MELHGLDQLLRNLDRISDAKLQAAKDGMGEVAEIILGKAQEICPVSPSNPKHPLYIGTSGSLRDSGTVSEVERDGNALIVEVGFDVEYAAAVHERMQVNHQYPGSGNPRGQAKFLEVAMAEMRDKAMPFIAGKVRAAG